MTTKQIPTEEEVLGYMTSLSNWGRGGADDELGTLNLITPEKRTQASFATIVASRLQFRPHRRRFRRSLKPGVQSAGKPVPT